MKTMFKRALAIVMSFVMILTIGVFDTTIVDAKIVGQSSAVIKVDGTTQFEVSDNSRLDDSYSWTSLNANVATVSEKGSHNDHIGVVTGKNPGSTTISCYHTWKNWEQTGKKFGIPKYGFVKHDENVNFTITVEKADARFNDFTKTLVYSGNEQTLSSSDIASLIDSKLYTEIVNENKTSQISAGFTTSAINAGTYRYTVSTPETASFKAGSKTYSVTVNKANPTVVTKPNTQDMESDTFGSTRVADCALTGGKVVGVKGETLEGTWDWSSAAKKKKISAAFGNNSDSYDAIFTPVSGNYNTATEKVSFYIYWYGLRDASVVANDITYSGETYSNLTTTAIVSSQGDRSWKTRVDEAELETAGLTYTYYVGAYTSLNALDVAIANGTAVALSGAPVDAGTYTVLASVASSKNTEKWFRNFKLINHSGCAGFRIVDTFTISPKTITADMVSVNGSNADGTVVYSGSAATATVVDGSTTLVAGTDYTVTSNNIDVTDSAVVIVAGTGNYTGTVSKTFAIVQKDLTESTEVSITTDMNYNYTGDEIAVNPSDVTVMDGSVALIANVDFQIDEESYVNNIDIGEATVDIEFIGNYTGRATLHYNITSDVYVFLHLSEGTDARKDYAYLGQLKLSSETNGDYRNHKKETDGYRPEVENGSVVLYDEDGNRLDVLSNLITSGDYYVAKPGRTLYDFETAAAMKNAEYADTPEFFKVNVSFIKWVGNCYHIDLELVDNSYNITFMSELSDEEDNSETVGTVRVANGSAIATTDIPEAPSKDKYSFVAWVDELGNEVDLTEALDEDTTVYASYVYDYYTLTFATTGNETDDVVSNEISKEESVSVDLVESAKTVALEKNYDSDENGYFYMTEDEDGNVVRVNAFLAGWSTDDSSVDEREIVDVYAIREDATLYPIFSEVATEYYTVTFMNGDKVVAELRSEYGKAVVAPIFSTAEMKFVDDNDDTHTFTFDGWVDESGEVVDFELLLDTDATVYTSISEVVVPAESRTITVYDSADKTVLGTVTVENGASLVESQLGIYARDGYKVTWVDAEGEAFDFTQKFVKNGSVYAMYTVAETIVEDEKVVEVPEKEIVSDDDTVVDDTTGDDTTSDDATGDDTTGDDTTPATTTPATTTPATTTPAGVAPAAAPAVNAPAVVNAQTTVNRRTRTTTTQVATIDDEETPLAAEDTVEADEETVEPVEVEETVENATISDDETPLAAAEDNCFMHWIILLLSIAVAMYTIARVIVLRREESAESQEA